MNSRDAQIALKNGARYVPGSFMHNGGMSLVLKKLFTKVFKHSPAQQGFDFNPEIPSVLQNALQSATATIVNARADYVMKNMKRLFKDNGMPEVELRWWRGSQKFHEGYTTGDGITAPPGLQDALDDLLPPAHQAEPLKRI